MKYVLRKTPDRNTAYLERLLPNPLIFNDVERRGAVWSFHEAIKAANDDAVYIQDDMLLCKDFAPKAEEYIAKHWRSVIVFSALSDVKKPLRLEEGFWEPKIASWLLCTYIPRPIAQQYLSDVESGRWQIEKRYYRAQYDDLNFRDWLQSKKKKVFLTVPNLAGHPANVSVVDIQRPLRLSMDFDYENAEPRLEGEEQEPYDSLAIFKKRLKKL